MTRYRIEFEPDTTDGPWPDQEFKAALDRIEEFIADQGMDIKEYAEPVNWDEQ